MGATERNELFIEKQEVIVIHRRGEAHSPFCFQCGNLAIMMTLEEATAITKVSMRLLCRLADEGKIHFLETSKGVLLLCSRTLFQVTATDSQGLMQNQSVEVKLLEAAEPIEDV